MTPSVIPDLRSLFRLDPEVVYLNHGSFGACPIPVFEAYQEWQRRLEREPVRFLAREFLELDGVARQALAAFLHVEAEDVGYIPNATYGINLVARSLALRPGDEVLSTDHEYGACDRIWTFVGGQTGARYVRQAIPLPIESPADFVDRLWEGVTPRTEVIFLSHITSPTAQLLPVEAVCSRARAAGIRTVIDGAHAPGMIPLDLGALGADVYIGDAHKWMLSPKGAGFLYVRRELQPTIEPLVVSWGWGEAPTITTGHPFPDILAWPGTRDPAAALSVPTALAFQHQHDWDRVRQDALGLLRATLERLDRLTGLPALYPKGEDGSQASPPLPPMMGVAQLPDRVEPAVFQRQLFDEFHIEVPVIEWGGRRLLRLSLQAYNRESDADALVLALDRLGLGRDRG